MKNNDFEWWNPLGTLLESESAGDTFQMIGDTFKISRDTFGISENTLNIFGDILIVSERFGETLGHLR